MDMNMGIDTDTDSGHGYKHGFQDMDTGMDIDMDTNTDTNIDTNIDTDMITDVDMDIDMDMDMDTDMNSDMDPDMHCRAGGGGGCASLEGEGGRVGVGDPGRTGRRTKKVTRPFFEGEQKRRIVELDAANGERLTHTPSLFHSSSETATSKLFGTKRISVLWCPILGTWP